jgi:YbbR domain-containing protein
MLPQNGHGEGKRMDKIFDSPWALRITSLIFAVALFFYVQSLMDDERKSNSTLQADIDILIDVPLEVYYDETNLIVSGLPDTVDIKIEGPMTSVMQTKLLKDYKAFVDLNSLLIGEHSVTIQTENFSEKLTVTVDPKIVQVTIEEKVTQEFRVEPEMNSGQIADNLVLDSMEVTPQRVMITGAKSIIDSISYVKASVKADESIQASFKQQSNVVVLNKDLSKLDVVIEPQRVEVSVNVKPYTRKIPLVLELTNANEESEININNFKLLQDTVEVTGPKQILDALTEVIAQIDLSSITSSGEYEVTLLLPEGVKKMTGDAVLVRATLPNTRTDEQLITDPNPD